MDEKYRKLSAIILVSLLVLLLIYALWPFVSAFFGALIFYVLFKPFYKYIRKKYKLGRGVAAMVIIVISLILIILPIIIALILIAGEVAGFFQNQEVILAWVEYLSKIAPSIDFKVLLENQLSGVGEFVAGLFLDILKRAGKMVINLTIMYFALYYLLVQETSVFKRLSPYMPFNKKNTEKLIEEFKSITYSTVFATGIIAVFQGGLITVAFLIFGIKGAFFWGFIAFILSFLPIIGPPIVWIPAVIIKFLDKSYGAATGIFIFGLFISTADNFIRPYLQRKVGRIHPLVSLVGFFIGIPLFGLFGIVIGPILVSYVLLTIKMFKEEYIV